MRHSKGFRKLNKVTDQRLALLASLTRAVFINKQINTTLIRAKEASKMINRLITVAKKGTVTSRREVYKVLPDRDLIKSIICLVEKLPERSGSYLRTTMLGRRKGDATMMARLEIIDANSISKEVSK